MQREILFRGMRTDGNGWVQGNLINWHPNKSPRIIWFELDPSKFSNGFNETNFEVDPKTVGQFTGLLDKNGTKIFEGDVVEVIQSIDVSLGLFDEPEYKTGILTASIYYNAELACFDFDVIDKDNFVNGCSFYPELMEDIEVIGNLHDLK